MNSVSLLVRLAQRALHWDNVEVAAHLDAQGRLLVTETQTMVFNGEPTDLAPAS